MSPKELTALAKACRKAGITYFKNDKVEFELGPEQSQVVTKRARKRERVQAEMVELTEDLIESDGWDNLTLEQKLNWSSDPLLEETEGNS